MPKFLTSEDVKHINTKLAMRRLNEAMENMRQAAERLDEAIEAAKKAWDAE